MKGVNKIKNINLILWTARIWGGLSLVFLGMFIVGHIRGTEPLGQMSPVDMISFLAFPLGLMIGLSVAYKKPALGVWIGLGSMVLFYILRPDVLRNPLVAILAFPLMIYLAEVFSPRAGE